MNTDKVLKKLLGKSRNVQFNEFVAVIEAFGFVLDRSKGSHHIYKHKDIPLLINIQNYKGQKLNPIRYPNFCPL